MTTNKIQINKILLLKSDDYNHNFAHSTQDMNLDSNYFMATFF
jgi:hypothetical protein